ncbi:MAG: DNA polymerase II large subunit, partial [Candidatus Heimdallarchaeota archaeon]|nr:DNA polymerase II large subunit [Candidatus Heimdallarchaeota archaeon]
IVMPVDTLHPPIVKLKNGDVIKVQTYEEAGSIKKQIEEILFLGDMLYGVGEFNQNSYDLIPAGYCEEWWIQELEEHYMDLSTKKKDLVSKEMEDKIHLFIQDPFHNIPSPEEAIAISRIFNIALHPEYTYHWNNISVDDFKFLRGYVETNFNGKDKALEIPHDEQFKAILEEIFIPHKVTDNKIIFKEDSSPFLISLGLHNGKTIPIPKKSEKIIDIINSVSKIKIKSKCPVYSGARMGRPEKAKGRRMKPPVHLLFPIEEKGGRLRDLYKASENKTVSLDLVKRKCPQCGKFVDGSLCNSCNVETEFQRRCKICNYRIDEDICPKCGRETVSYDRIKFSLEDRVRKAKQRITGTLPKNVKAVKKLMNKDKVPELIEKGILRAKHNIFVYRDGTIRFDATDAILTHFKPLEIGSSIQKLHECGYTVDIHGKSLEEPTQIVELKIQDIILN